MPRLANKVALITGAAAGQGAAFAEAFVREGAAVMLTDIDVTAGATTTQRLSQQGGRVQFRRHEVADESGWQESVAATVAAFGGLHILVNNAGTIAREGILDTTLDGWNRTIAVNLTGPMLGMKHAALAIRDSGGGSIINLSSTAGMTAYEDAAYAASKWALRGLTKTAVLQFSDWNIRVNSIHPGTIADTSFAQLGGEGFVEAAEASIPLGRLGLPRDTAALVVFLASEQSSFINGAEVAIDGGYIAAGTAHLRSRARNDYVKRKN